MRVPRTSYVAALGLLAVLATTGCSAQDRAGGTADVEVVTIDLAQPNGEPDQALVQWAEYVEEQTEGTLRIQFQDDYGDGPQYETQTVQAVADGSVDAGWVGARVFDRLGVTAFQPLLAPMLIDSQDLQGEVLKSGIPAEMMAAGLEGLEVHGLGVIPGPMRKVLSKGEPLTSPTAFHGLRVGIQDSAVAEQAFAALGATSVPLPTGADISDVDAYEQQLGSVNGNHYELEGGKSVVGNLNLWPRPLVIVMNDETWAGLTDAQQEVVASAADEVVDSALEAARTDDESGASAECAAGLPLPQADPDQLSAFTEAFRPVYDAIGADPESKAWLDEIAALKSQLGSAPDAAVCDAPTDGAAVSTPIDGTYTWTLTPEDWAGCSGDDGTNTYELTLEDGRAVIYVTGDVTDGEREVGFSEAFTVYRDKFQFEFQSDTVTMSWQLDDDQLAFSDIQGGDCTDEKVWTSEPMHRQ